MKTATILLCLLLVSLSLPDTAQAEKTQGKIEVDRDQLSGATPISVLLSEKVRLMDGREVGEIEDALLISETQVDQFLVDLEINEESDRGTASFRDDVANYEEPPLYESESNEKELQLEYVAVPPAEISYRAADNAARMNLGIEGISALPRTDGPIEVNEPKPYVSRIIGMEVNLNDEDSFGSIEDIMVKDGRIVAYVVDSWKGIDKRRHALPADDAEFQRAEKQNAIREEYGVEAIRFPYTAAQLDELQEFDLSEHKNEGWLEKVF